MHASSWPVRLHHGPVTLRPLRRRDEEDWARIRQRSGSWFRPWDSTRPPDATEPGMTFAQLVATFSARARRGQMLSLIHILIRNDKTVDPADPTSPKVIQLESAMGAAIEVFPGATAIAVGRDRFLPVKTTNELMLLRSDVFDLAADGRLRAVSDIPEIALGSHYKLVDEFDRLVTVVPSLRRARSLRVAGVWHFDTPSEVCLLYTSRCV